MVKVLLSDRERFAIYMIVNPMSHPDRASRRSWDRLWDVLKLDEIAERIPIGNQAPHLLFDNEERKEFQSTSDQRDMLIDKVCGAPNLNTHFGRMLNRCEIEMLKGRDGPSLASIEAAE